MNVKQLERLEFDICNSITEKMMESGYLGESKKSPYEKFLSYIKTPEGKEAIDGMHANAQKILNQLLGCDGKFTHADDADIICASAGDCIRTGRRKCPIAERTADNMQTDAIVNEREHVKATKKDVSRLLVDEIAAKEHN
ncbi:MAG: hypothetical protein LBI17_02395 [Rickettsiales bacterium]|jgi:hypothetical protein|nr:hypothetical protein [Rickettsiales bacterium]